MKTVKGFSKIVAMVGAVALGLTLSACGNTNSASNTDSKNSGSTPTVSFMLDWTPNTNHIGLYVAQKLGYYKDAGVNVKILPTAQAGAETSVENGVANVGFTTLSNVAAFNSQGADLKFVFDLTQKPVARWCALASRTDIKTPKDLSGKTFVSFGSAAQTIPLITIAPLFMIWFGFEPLGKIVIVAVFGVFPVAVQTCRGMLAVPQFYEDVALTCGATRAWALWHVKLRVAARQVFGGLRISAAYVFGTAVTAEYLGAMNGLGIWLQAAFNSFRTPLIFSATIMVVALTALLLTIISLAERLLLGPDDTIAFNDDGE